MRLAHKILIGLAVAIVVLIGVPATYAIATGKSQALKGLVQALKHILKAHKETLEAMIDAYKQFLGSL